MSRKKKRQRVSSRVLGSHTNSPLLFLDICNGTAVVSDPTYNSHSTHTRNTIHTPRTHTRNTTHTTSTQAQDPTDYTHTHTFCDSTVVARTCVKEAAEIKSVRHPTDLRIEPGWASWPPPRLATEPLAPTRTRRCYVPPIEKTGRW